MATQYEVRFNYYKPDPEGGDLMKHCGTVFVDYSNVNHAMEGFWLNRDLEFTRGNDGLLWVPPSQIIGIIKLG